MILYVNRMATMGKVSARRVLGASSDRRGASVLAVGTPRHTVHNKKMKKLKMTGWDGGRRCAARHSPDPGRLAAARLRPSAYRP